MNSNQVSQEENNKKNASSSGRVNTRSISNSKHFSSVKSSFTITYILLLTTSLITFIEAIRTQSPIIRHLFNLETCISLVAGYFYSIFVNKINSYEHKNIPINWTEITQLRYIDWSITICLSIEKNDIVKLDYGLLNLSIENKNNIENIKKLSRDEKDLKLLES